MGSREFFAKSLKKYKEKLPFKEWAKGLSLSEGNSNYLKVRVMTNTHLRACEKKGEILNGLVRLSIREGSGFLWQRASRNRKLWPIKVTGLDVNQKVLKVSVDCDLEIPLEDSIICLDFEEIESDKDLYFKGNEKDILFKCHSGDFYIHDEIINMAIPSHVFFREYRKYPRLSPNGPLLLSLKTSNKGRDNINLTVECQNIGKGGIGASIAQAQGHLLDKGDSLYLEKVGSVSLAHALSLQVVYKRQTKKDDVSKVQMGLSFKDELSDAILSDILVGFI